MLAGLLAGCAEQKQEKEAEKLFSLTSVKQTKLDFKNTLKENDTINYFTYPYIYMGGGVSVGDVNGDGLQDIYFTGNMVLNRLYLNQGELKFKDITSEARVGGDLRWVTGCAMADVNNDGLLDIYVSVSGKYEPHNNLLYINQGNNTEGIPVFREMAAEYGLDDAGRSTQAIFLDYDQDGDLDVYVANYPSTSFKARVRYYRSLINNPEHDKSSHLYRNDGNNKFTDVTKEAGLLTFSLTLSATAADFNDDGFTDLYVSNDFAVPDYFYINNGDGTFTDRILETTNQTAFYGMGSDAADFNNDGLVDLVQMDMTPEDNRRSKANMASMNIPGFWEIIGNGFHYQYMQNVLQVNRGTMDDGLPFFSNISRMSGVAQTDWSWAPLLADFDNDGWKDLMITNGTRRDINHKDYFIEVDEKRENEKEETLDYLELTNNIPSEKVDNYIYRNNGDLTFSRANDDWGLSFTGYSNGIAYADLDNDGDLDIVINNIDDEASLFENLATQKEIGNYLKVDLQGPEKNPLGIGTKVYIKQGGQTYFIESNMVRGFQSSIEPILHFGLGDISEIEELTVIWPDRKMQVLTSLPVNQTLVVRYEEAKQQYVKPASGQKLFTDNTEDSGVDHTHTENRYDDYSYQILLPHRISNFGPALAVGDMNNDGLDDFYVGGSTYFPGALYQQKSDGSFKQLEGPWHLDSAYEDVGAVFFDANNDNLPDLYVVSGGNEWTGNSNMFKDRLYINKGDGFEKTALPEIAISGSCVVPADFDGDGDLDLFIGGRITPHEYPLPPSSVILENRSTPDGIEFVDVTSEIAFGLADIGMVTSAIWMDFNNDDQLDLVIAGEWMPVTFMAQQNGEFVDVSEDVSSGSTRGWWFSMKKGDLDGDGDDDLVVGNLGTNYKYQATPEETFDIYAGDFDGNKKIDIVLGYYNEGEQYPVRGKQCSSQQILAIKVKYDTYDEFATATLEDIYTADGLTNSLHYSISDFKSGWLENDGLGKFVKHDFPNEAQESVIQGTLFDDFDGDGNKDILIAGNFYVSEVETPRNDAGIGLLMTGDGTGEFTPVPFTQSGFFAPRDVRHIGSLRTPNGVSVIVVNNSDEVVIFKANNLQRSSNLAALK